MSTLTPDQQAIAGRLQQHTYAEFVLKDADAALATMTENPSVLLISSGTGGTGPGWPAIGSDSYQDVVVRLN